MLFSDAVFNIFAGVFDVLNGVHRNVAVFCYFCIRLFQTSSMLLFVSVCCYAKPRCYYSCLYAVMRNLDAIIRVSNYIRLNPVFRELDRYGLARVIN